MSEQKPAYPCKVLFLGDNGTVSVMELADAEHEGWNSDYGKTKAILVSFKLESLGKFVGDCIIIPHEGRPMRCFVGGIEYDTPINGTRTVTLKYKNNYFPEILQVVDLGDL